MPVQWVAHQHDAPARQRHRGHCHLALRLACLLLLATLLAGCLARASSGTTITKQRDLQQLPEEHLFYPGSVVTGQFGGDQERTIEGTNHAFSGYALGVKASEDEVKDFYRRELAARGWQESPIDIVSVTGERRALAWRKGDLVFRISVLDKGDPRNPKAGDAYETPYTIRVMVWPRSR